MMGEELWSTRTCKMKKRQLPDSEKRESVNQPTKKHNASGVVVKVEPPPKRHGDKRLSRRSKPGRPVVEVDKRGRAVAGYLSIQEATRVANVGLSAINRSIHNGGLPTLAGRCFRFKHRRDELSHGTAKPVREFDSEGRTIQVRISLCE